MRLSFALFLYCLITTALPGVQTEALRQDSYDDFSPGELAGLSLSDLGEISPGPGLTQLAEIDADSILAAVRAEDGTLYLGTGTLGKIYKLAPDGEPELILEPREVMTRALAIGPDGALYAATSPGGRVYRIVDGKRPEVYFDPEEMYVWDLLFDKDGALFVATGNDAKIYRLPPDFMPGNEAEEWFTTDRTHVNTLAFDHEGRLLAGAGPKAYLYRIPEKGKAEVLFNAGTDEIAAIEADADGTITFATIHNNGAPPTFASASPLDLPTLLEKVQRAAKANNGNGGSGNGKSDDGDGSSPTSGPSFLYRVTPEGFGEAVWSPGGPNILCFVRTSDGGFLVGTDNEAKLFSVHSLTDWAYLARAETGGVVSALIPEDNGDVLVMTSNPAAVYRMASAAPEERLYTSEPLDAGAIARWGRLLPVGDGVADAESVAWRTRGGNSPEPDDTWGEWADATDLAVASAPSRYLQYETTFKGEKAALRELRIFYTHHNAAPVVNRINVIPVGIQVINLAAPPKPPVNLNQLTGSKEIAIEASEGPQVRTQVRFSGDAGSFSFGWNAFDPNDDSLTYSLAVAPEGTEDFAVLVDELTESVYSTSMRGFADGYYRAKVTASDADSNPPGEGLSGSLVSSLFLIDNGSPSVTVESQQVDGTTATVVFRAEDAFSIITAADYRLDGKPAREAFPDSGFFDARTEHFTLKLDGLKSGAHSLLLEVTDEAGNKASAQVTLTVE